MLGGVVVERQQLALVIGDLRDRFGEFGAVVSGELSGRGSGTSGHQPVVESPGQGAYTREPSDSQADSFRDGAGETTTL